MNIIHKITNFIDYVIEDFSTPFYRLLVLLLYLIYIVTTIGIAYINPDYASYLNRLIQFFIAIVLVIRFNPFRKKLTCNVNDRTFILASSFFLLINDEFITYIKNIFSKYVPLKKLSINNQM
jgi:hypothetical protein